MGEAVTPRAPSGEVYRLMARLGGTWNLAATLQSVVDGVVEGLGFGVAVVNLVREDGMLEVAAVAGDPAVRDALLGQVGRRSDWDVALAAADEWGALRYVPHQRHGSDGGALPTWVPAVTASEFAGAWHPLDALFAPLYTPAGELVGVLSVDLPVDGRRPGRAQCELLELYAVQAGTAIDNARLHAQLQASEALFRRAFDDAPIGMAISDLRPGRAGRYLRVNDALCELLGYRREQLLQMSFRDVTHPEDCERDASALAAAIAEGLERYRAEKRYLRADGEVVWVAVSSCVIPDPVGAPTHFVSQFVDITARKRTEQQLARQALHDPLTGLANRILLLERLEHGIATARRHGQTGAVLFCDLDGFKGVNDLFGHAAGDALLIEVAARLTDQVRAVDTVGRLGGDEFVVLLENVDAAGAAAFAERIRHAIAVPLRVADVAISVTVSVGIAMVDDGTRDADAVLHAADRWMYAEKRRLHAVDRRHRARPVAIAAAPAC